MPSKCLGIVLRWWGYTSRALSWETWGPLRRLTSFWDRLKLNDGRLQEQRLTQNPATFSVTSCDTSHSVLAIL